MEEKDIPNLEDYAILDKVIADDEVKWIKDIVNPGLKNTQGFGSGLTFLDDAMEGGFRGGDLVVLSGISGEGKTTLAQTFSYHLCKKGVPILWFSYEVSIERLHQKFEAMGISDFYYACAPKKNTTGNLAWIEFKIKEASLKFAIKVVFIDHIDFLTPMDTKTSDNEAIALKRIATQLKDLAVKLNVTIVIMAHLKKLPDGKEPDMQDIGYSAGIFQLSDYVMMIWRLRNKQPTRKLEFSNSDQGEIYSNNSKIKIVKNRLNGRTAFANVIFKDYKFCLESDLETNYPEAEGIDLNEIKML